MCFIARQGGASWSPSLPLGGMNLGKFCKNTFSRSHACLSELMTVGSMLFVSGVSYLMQTPGTCSKYKASYPPFYLVMCPQDRTSGEREGLQNAYLSRKFENWLEFWLGHLESQGGVPAVHAGSICPRQPLGAVGHRGALPYRGVGTVFTRMI